MNKLTLALLILLTGCSPEPTFKDVANPVVKITISENPMMIEDGLAYMSGGKCEIILKRYPRCLKHEVRHCLEGQWHGEDDSSVDCY